MRVVVLVLGAVLFTSNALITFAAHPTAAYDRKAGQVVLTNGRLELLIETRSSLNPRRLRDLRSGRVYADADYMWPGGQSPRTVGEPGIEKRPDGGSTITLKGQLGEIMIEQSFTAPASEAGVILESLTITNPTDRLVATSDFKCGFAKQVREGERWLDDSATLHFSPVPYLRETDGRLMDWPLREVVGRGMSYTGWVEPPRPTRSWGAEGWVWGDGTSTFLIAKYNSNAMEWSLMESQRRGSATVVRFAGAGQWKDGIPEEATRLEPGKSFRFGETLLQVVDGDWKQGYYAYRRYTESKGVRPHNGYNPPVHWNELYDCPYYFASGVLDWWKTDTNPPPLIANRSLLDLLYTLDAMKAEAAKAKELGCEALYLDPGWDTNPSHHVWDAKRLGTMDSFVKMLSDEYGLKLSFWIGLAGVPPTYGDPDACPVEARVVDREGKRTDLQCFPSTAFLDTKTQRLIELGRQGAAFMMMDSTQYTGPCYQKSHNHSIPSTREEHARALLELTQRVKSQYPQLLIEMHDPISGPGGVHYTPAYFMYDKPNSFDCIWGQEFMWDSMNDLLQGRALSLYYYNLAYSLPMYLHVNLKNDNENALVFWWYASTIRHLGVGGKSSNPSVWAAHKQAMQTYLPLKRFYSQGIFYGLDEMVHAHTLPDLRQSVIDCFNLGGEAVEREVTFRPAEIGLASGKVQVEGATAKIRPDQITLLVSIPAKGHKLVKVSE